VESIDYVTRSGAGGRALAESAEFTKLLEEFNEGGLSDMDTAEIKKLQEGLAAQVAINERLLRRAIRADAVELGTAVLATTGLNEAQRKYVIESVVGAVDAPKEIAVKEGALDSVKLTESINAAAKAYVATLPNGARVQGLGGAPALQLVPEPEEIAAREAARKREEADEVAIFESLMGNTDAAKAAAKGRAA
jgi:hypothetical protein